MSTRSRPRSLDSAPVLVFLHGGVHTGACWDETAEAIRAIRPDVEILLADLPGRRDVPGDLATLTIEECVSSVCDQILPRVQLDRPLIVVGHSLAGVILPGVVNKLGPHIVEHVILVATCVPPKGQSVVDALPVVLKPIVRLIARRPVIARVPQTVSRWFFGNHASRRQREHMQAHFCSESSRLLTEVPSASFPKAVRKSWILTTHDRALPPAIQRRFIDGVGGIDSVVELNAGHEVMFTHPRELADAIGGLVR